MRRRKLLGLVGMDRVAIEDTASGQHEAQAAEEAARESGAVVEESTDGEHKAEIRRGAASVATTGRESADGEHMAELKGGEPLEEMMSSSSGQTAVGGHGIQATAEDTVNETMGNDIVEKKAVEEHKGGVSEEEHMNRVTSNVLFEERASDESNAPVHEEEQLGGTSENAIFNVNAVGRQGGQAEGELVSETVSNLSAGERADGEDMTDVREGKALHENMDDAIVEGKTDFEHGRQVRQEESFSGSVDNCVVKGLKGADAEDKAQIGNKLAIDETVGDCIIEEGTDGRYTPQAGVEPSGEKLANLIVEQNTDCRYRTQVANEGELDETMDDVVVEEKSDHEHRPQTGSGLPVDGTVSDCTLEEKIDGKHTPQAREEPFGETLENVMAEPGSDCRLMTQVANKRKLDDVNVEGRTDHEQTSQVGKEEVLAGEETDVQLRTQIGNGVATDETVGHCIVEEKTGSKHTAQGGEELCGETFVNIIAEQSTDCRHKAQVAHEGESDDIMDDVIVEGGTDHGHIMLTETMDYMIVEERNDGNNLSQSWVESLNAKMQNVIVSESAIGETEVKIEGKKVLDETTGTIVMESNDEKHKVQVIEEVSAPNNLERQVTQSSQTGDVSITQSEQHVGYHLPLLDKENFCISDLVWGKVKSHPWWPGQIIDPSDASKLALKYQKKDSFLIAYFGDKTFAWCDESQLKPFDSYFSQLEKQCSSDTFAKGICDILTEVSRRIELGMACSCLPEEDSTSVKHQKIENAGVRGGNINSLISRPTIANYFQPSKLLEYIKTLAQFPNGRVDRFEFVVARSQLKAFYHSKGYPELPVFNFTGGLLESVSDNPPCTVKGPDVDVDEHFIPVSSRLVCGQVESISEDIGINRLEDWDEDISQQQGMSKLMGDRSMHLANGGMSSPVAKAAGRPGSSSSGKRHIVVESDPVDSGRCKKRMLDLFEDLEFKSPSPTVTSSFKIGEFIRRAASQLTGAPPIVKSQGEQPQHKCDPQSEFKKNDVAEFDIVFDSPTETYQANLSFTEDYDSSDEMLLQLYVVATDPMQECSFLPNILAFFTEFRNFCVSGGPSEEKEKEHMEKRKRGRPRKVVSEQQQPSSDMSTSEDEKQGEKRKRGMLKNVISQLAASDVSSAEEKPVEKRKRGRPRKNPLPVGSDSSEDKKIVQKPKRGRPRGRPRKVDPQLASPEYSSSENRKPLQKRKRGRPRKIAPSNFALSDHVKDTYWSDRDLQRRQDGASHMQSQKKRRKSTGESLALSSTPISCIEHHLQLVAMNPNVKHTCVAESSMVSVEEKIMDERMPTALFLSFNNANSLPSETDLIRIFCRYGPLKEAETDVMRKTNRAKVVFKRRVDAESAFNSAGKYSIFGPGLLSYQLKPWTPKSAPQAPAEGPQDTATPATQQESQGAALVSKPQENHDVDSLSTAPEEQSIRPTAMTLDDHDAAASAIPLDKHYFAIITSAVDSHNLVSPHMVQDHDVPAAIAPKLTSDAGPTFGSNSELSEQVGTMFSSNDVHAEAERQELLEHGQHDTTLIMSLQENQVTSLAASCPDERDSGVTSTQDNLDFAPIAIVQSNLDAPTVITEHDKCDAGYPIGIGMHLSEQAEGLVVSDSIQIEAEDEESTPHDKNDTAKEKYQGRLPVTSLPDEHDHIPTSTQDNMESASITMVQDNHNVAAGTSLQEQGDDGPTVRSNMELSEQAEAVIASDTFRAELVVESSAADKHDSSLTSEPQVNLSLTDMGSNMELSEKPDDGLASDRIQVKVDGTESSLLDKHDPLRVVQQENQELIPVISQVYRRDVRDTCFEETSVRAPDTVLTAIMQESHDPSVTIVGQDKIGAATPGTNQDLSEQPGSVIASDSTSTEIEDNKSSPKHNHDEALNPQNNQAAEPVASSITISQDDEDPAAFPTSRYPEDAKPLNSLPEDNHHTTPITALENHADAVLSPMLTEQREAASITTAQDDQEAVPVVMPNHDTPPNTTGNAYDDLPVAAVQDNLEAAVTSLQRECHPSPTSENIELSGQADVMLGSDIVQTESQDNELPPQDSDKPALTATLPLLKDKHDSTPTNAQENLHATEQGNVMLSSDTTQTEQQDDEPLPQDTQESVLIATHLSLIDKHDSSLTATQDNATAINIPQDNEDAASITTKQRDQSAEPVSAEDNKHDLEPTNIVLANVEDNQAAAVVITDKRDEPTEGINKSRLSGQVVDVIASGTIQAGGEGMELFPQDKPGETLVPIPSKNQDPHLIPSLLEKQDPAPTTMQNKVDAAAITRPNAEHKAGLTEGGDQLEISGQAESRMASETMQDEAQDGSFAVPEQAETETVSNPMHV